MVEIVIRGDSHYARPEAMARRGLLAASLPGIGSKASWPFASRACWPCPFQGSDQRPPGLRWLERNQVRYVFGLAGNRVLLDRVAELAEDTAVRRAEEDADKIRNFHDFRYAAKS